MSKERLRALALTVLILDVIRQSEQELKQSAAVTVELSRIRICHLPLLPNS